MKKNFKKGFTLIELLVVIAIIGILASVVLVSLSSATGKAKRASALTTVSGLGTEFLLCGDDSGNIQAPTSGTTGGNNICSASGHTVTWPSLSTGNTGYCYSAASGNCTTVPYVTAVAANTGTTQTFYLYNSATALITCTWSGTQNLQCN